MDLDLLLGFVILFAPFIIGFLGIRWIFRRYEQCIKNVEIIARKYDLHITYPKRYFNYFFNIHGLRADGKVKNIPIKIHSYSQKTGKILHLTFKSKL